MNYNEVISILKSKANPKNIEGMARFGIKSSNILGISMPEIRKVGKEIGKNHELALQLWDSGIHEARILASIIDNKKEVTEAQMDKWVSEFDTWDVCDQVCGNLFCYSPIAFDKVYEWAKREEEFVRRAAFSLIAYLAVHQKKMDDKEFLQFLPLIKKYSIDERNFVRKAVNWSLRQIGKRSAFLQKEAIKSAEEIEKLDSPTAKWIAKDALKELKSRVILK